MEDNYFFLDDSLVHFMHYSPTVCLLQPLCLMNTSPQVLKNASMGCYYPHWGSSLSQKTKMKGQPSLDMLISGKFRIWNEKLQDCQWLDVGYEGKRRVNNDSKCDGLKNVENGVTTHRVRSPLLSLFHHLHVWWLWITEQVPLHQNISSPTVFSV